MKNIFIHNTFFRALAPIFFGILAYLLILLTNNDLSQLGSTFMNQEVYVCIGLTYLLSEILRANVIVIGRFFKTDPRSQLLTQVFGGLFLSVVVISGVISLYFEWAYKFSITESQLIIFNAIYGVASLLYNLLYFSNIYVHKQNERLMEKEQVKADVLASELVQFKNEVNPELLYESLEMLITLVHRDVEESEDYIDRLSSVYRYILSHRKVELSTLQQEIKAARNITHLLNYRFNDQISFTVNIPDGHQDLPIVPGTLPNLLEMITRSTIVNKFKPLVVELQLEAEDGYLVVQHQLNDRLGKKSFMNGAFATIQKTYSFYSDKPVVCVKAYDFSYIKIPLLEQAEETLELSS